MSDRKVLNRYIPNDFDPSIVPPKKRLKNGQFTINMMMPFTVRCNSCGAYITRGKKFNARQETVKDENYLGIKIYRFYIKCDVCRGEFTIKTDPKNTDYVCEFGAHRTYNAKKAQAEAEAEEKRQREEDEKDAMVALENKTSESKSNLDFNDALEEIMELNIANNRSNSVDKVFDQFSQADAEAKQQKKLAEDAEIEEEFQRLKKMELPKISAGIATGGAPERGKDDKSEESTKDAVRDILSTFKGSEKEKKIGGMLDNVPLDVSFIPIDVEPINKEKESKKPSTNIQQQQQSSPPSSSGEKTTTDVLGLCCCYDSDSDSDSDSD